MVLECSRSHDAIRRRKNRPFIGNACPKCKRFSSVSPPISREIRRRLRLCRASRSIRLRYRPIARWAIRALFSPYCPTGNTGSFSPRGCATLHPGLCSGAHSGRGWWDRSDGRGCASGFRPGVALRYTPSCVLAPIQGAGGGVDRMGGDVPGFASRGSATLHPGLCSGAPSGRGWWDRSDGRGR